MKLLPLLAASVALALALSASADTPAGSCCGTADAKKEGCCAEANKTADCAACAEGTKTTAKPADKAARHPLKGVVVDVRADRNALVVKHEEIPGVMKAMTMLLKVDEPTLKAAKKNQAINALLVRKADGWWLEEVKPAT